ncbi:MAG: cyclophilin-like fold protein [Candidatus Omnitrophota bacterium]
MQVSFQTPHYNLLVDLNDTDCAKKIIEILPLDSEICKWSEGVYFKINVNFESENFVKDINEGDVVYWPEGKAIGIFFGTAPMTVADKQVPVWKLIKIGQTKVDILGFQSMREADEVRVATAEKEEEIISVDSVPEPDRKLSQSEIDVLVQKLLAQKKSQGK